MEYQKGVSVCVYVSNIGRCCYQFGSEIYDIDCTGFGTGWNSPNLGLK